MSPDKVYRAALGQHARLGNLYDARREAFTKHLILIAPPSRDIIKQTRTYSSKPLFIAGSTLKEKFNVFRVTPELGASFLTGLVSPQGAAEYLEWREGSSDTLEATIYVRFETVREELDFTGAKTRQILNNYALEDRKITHVVSEVSWGAQVVVTLRYVLSVDDKRAEVKQRLSKELEVLREIICPADERSSSSSSSLSSSSSGDDDEIPLPEISTFGHLIRFSIWSDLQLSEKRPLLGLGDVYKFLSEFPDAIHNTRDGKGVPIAYSLLPLRIFAYTLHGLSHLAANVPHTSPEKLEVFVKLFDDLRDCHDQVSDYYSDVMEHQFCIPDDHIKDVHRQVKLILEARHNLTAEYTAALLAIREGTLHSDRLDNLISGYQTGQYASSRLLSVVQYKDKMRLVDQLTTQKAQYIGYRGKSLEEQLRRNRLGDTYVFYFNEHLREMGGELWTGNIDTLLYILQDGRPKLVLLNDCDAAGDKNVWLRIVRYQNGETTCDDVYEERKLLADKCVARYDPKTLDAADTFHPPTARSVRIPCPGSRCPKERYCNWVCSKCFTAVDFGFIDQYIYCDCGRSQYKNYEFKCNYEDHGPDYEVYRTEKLLGLLETLEPSDELNILILGETGVGKSTFINAFVNYLTYQTLEEAIESTNSDALTYLIPSSFSTQVRDKESGERIQRQIKVGSDHNENNQLSGESATQHTQVHSFVAWNTTVRLIDTPGIGDTRGAKQDQKNMASILAALRKYDRLSGILILLKPNNARLDLTFRFCILELLTHLHRSAANNIVFGFTNTRGSNYTPGDTYEPLKKLLSNYLDSELTISQDRLYCFDSESFRYLAAYSQGVQIGDFDDYNKSWERSVHESQRLLNHFQSLAPHQTRNTLSLNETRHLIAQLTRPMADIAQSIKSSIAINEQNKQELQQKKDWEADTRRSKLHLQKVVPKAHKVDQPRTVCGHAACVEYRADGVDYEGRSLQKIYKSICHDPCHLHNVPVNSFGHEQLQKCVVFNNPKFECLKCSHSYLEHRHILYDVQWEAETIIDEDINDKLRASVASIEKKKAVIQAMEKTIEEFQAEHDAIQHAAVKFSLFLKEYSITPYNDATIEYLDVLIKDERGKVACGGSRQVLENLEKYRHQHEEMIKIFQGNSQTESREDLPDERGIERIINTLLNLKHFGQLLGELKDIHEQSHEATVRGESKRIRVRNQGAIAKFLYGRSNTTASSSTARSETDLTTISPGAILSNPLGSRRIIPTLPSRLPPIPDEPDLSPENKSTPKSVALPSQTSVMYKETSSPASYSASFMPMSTNTPITSTQSQAQAPELQSPHPTSPEDAVDHASPQNALAVQYSASTSNTMMIKKPIEPRTRSRIKGPPFIPGLVDSRHMGYREEMGSLSSSVSAPARPRRAVEKRGIMRRLGKVFGKK